MLPSHQEANAPLFKPVGTGFPGTAMAPRDGACTPAPPPLPEPIHSYTDHTTGPPDDIAEKAHDKWVQKDENDPPEGAQPPALAQRERLNTFWRPCLYARAVLAS